MHDSPLAHAHRLLTEAVNAVAAAAGSGAGDDELLSALTPARAAMVDFGRTLSPESLRMLCCDAAVIPIVMYGKGLPLDVGRQTRTIPEGVRRAVAARDRGCARCGRPASWCEIHHVVAWCDHGPTCVNNCVQVCKSCHRLIHHAGWGVRLVDGLPEFYPPPWIDPLRRPRRRPPPIMASAA